MSGFSPDAQIILQAMKIYGIVNADNGSAWYVSGAPNENWDNDILHELDVLNGSDFEAVDTTSLFPWIFKDVPDSYWASSYIERLYASGVTGGCGTTPLIYCPTTTVTRDQMAVFLLRGTGFADVPQDYWAAAWIKQLAAEGITAGCGNGNYCPTTPVTRDQMAVFLLKGKHGSGYVPPAAMGMFADVPTNYWAAAWIEQLAKEGITSGCSVTPQASWYCPGTPVTRDQMAVFLLKAKHAPGYVPPSATGVFVDVPQTYWAAAWIEALAEEGVTAGCGNNNYCPSTPVTRDQMAVFLVRNFNLP